MNRIPTGMSDSVGKAAEKCILDTTQAQQTNGVFLDYITKFFSSDSM